MTGRGKKDKTGAETGEVVASLSISSCFMLFWTFKGVSVGLRVAHRDCREEWRTGIGGQEESPCGRQAGSQGGRRHGTAWRCCRGVGRWERKEGPVGGMVTMEEGQSSEWGG